MAVSKEYEVLPDGGVRLHLPSGSSVRSALKPDLLEQIGYKQRTAPPEGRVAGPGGGEAPVFGSQEAKRAIKEHEKQETIKKYLPQYQVRKPGDPNMPNAATLGIDENKLAEGEAAIQENLKASQGKPDDGKQRISVPDGGAAGYAGAAVGGAPGRTIVLPGGFPRVSAQVQRGAEGLLPSAKDRDDTNNLIDGAIKQQADADLQGVDIMNRATDAAEQLRVQAENAIALRREKIVKDLNNRREILSRDMAEIENSRVDPKRFYRDRGGFAKALSFVAALAGGIRAGIQGGENQYLRRMDELAKRDIDAQIEMRGLKERGIKVRSTELDKLTDLMMGDQDAAAAQLRLQYGAMGDQLLREGIKQSGNRQVQAKLEMLLAQRQQQRQLESAQLWQQFGTKTVENFARVAPQVIQTGGASPKSKRQLDFANELQGLEVRARNKVGYLRGKVDSTTQRFRQNQINDYETFIDELGELRALATEAEKSGNPQMISQARSKIDALHNKLGAQENVLKGQGAMSDREYEAAMRGLGNLQSLFSKDTIGGEGLARIDENRASWDRNFRKFMENTVIEAPGDGRPLWEDDAWFYDFRNRQPFKLPEWDPTAERREPN